MTKAFKPQYALPPEQQAIRDKCFHPSGAFVEFRIEDVQTSIPERFEKIMRQFPDRVAVKTLTEVLTYRELDDASTRLAMKILGRRGYSAEPIGVMAGTVILSRVVSALAPDMRDASSMDASMRRKAGVNSITLVEIPLLTR